MGISGQQCCLTEREMWNSVRKKSQLISHQQLMQQTRAHPSGLHRDWHEVCITNLWGGAQLLFP